jgi:transposase
MEKDSITMSKKQLTRFDILSKTNAGFITVREASEALGLSERQVKRLKKKVRNSGADGVVHGNSGKPPSNRMSDDRKAEILRLWRRPEHAGCNFAHFREILGREHGIAISYGSLYAIMEAEGIKSPNTKRRRKPHRRRKRRAQAGLLLQTDATPYAWFQGDKGRYALHGAIDDATSQITGLFMTKNECLLGYFETFRRTVLNFGIPVSAYADRHTIFQSPNAKKHEIDASVPMNDTQFGRCLKELGVTLIAARSPQAKGRVERLWETLQSRLPVEFAICGIKTVEEANAFLETYIYEFNANFAVEPEDAQNAFRKIEGNENVDHILCIKETRIIDAGGVFSYGGKSFKIIDINEPLKAKTRIDVLIGPRIGVMATYRGKVFECLPFVPPKRKKAATPDKAKEPRKPSTPSPEHEWRTGRPESVITFSDRRYESDEAYRETVRLVERTLLGRNR